ncbi:MAG: CHASE2 domain-containing protein [Cyanobacteria bacterium Co-bin8]|nr:CHASE2 domain-containing protein [Cyanobacteria bacterium Co-bin8]
MTGKLVTLKLEGDLEQAGFQATLEIGPEGERPAIEVLGALPSNPELSKALESWQQSYHSLKGPTRIKPKEIVYLGSIHSLETCQQSAKTLRQRLKHWMASDPFRSIDQKLREELQREDTVRVLIRTASAQLHQMPWHLWDIVDRYPKAEVALSLPAFERRENPAPTRHAPVVKILAILGHSAGIDVAIDRQLLESLPQAAVTFLVEPQRQQINDQLWEAPWDILFFAGHSETVETTGRIHLNPQESLSLEELKYGLKQAITQGLQLAIFNSCEGLGLAYTLKELGLPYMIVMREPVPDRIAQVFLRHFLQAYAAGSSLYLAERQARERLQGLEGEFPCASWLPAIFQAMPDAPPDWQHLQQPKTAQSSTKQESVPLKLPVAMLTSLAAAVLVGASRWLGVLQPLELKALDWLMGQRPTEILPERVLVVEATEADLNEYGYPLPDAVLAQAIQKLQKYQPRVIGLDIFRAQLDPASSQLGQLLGETDNLIALCGVGTPDNPNKSGIPSPPNVPEERLGFSNVVVDPDGVIRRHLLFMQPSSNSPCATRFALSTLVAFHYLEQADIHPENLADHRLQLGKATFAPLESNTGPYHQADHWGFQILLNYSRTRSAPRSLSLSALLRDEVVLENLADQVVLLGVTAPISNPTDYFLTPFGARQWPLQKTSGVFLQAEMAHHLIAAAMDERPVLTALPGWAEGLWLVGWALIGGGIGWKLSRFKLWSLGLGGGIVLLYGACLGLLIQGVWVPLVPAALALVGSSSGLLLYSVQKNRPA